MDLAEEVGVSPRHLSFVETGRSRPSPELVLAIADRLAVPLRERNALLLAAGYAPRYTHQSLDDLALRHIRASLQRLLDAHDPYPGVVIDRHWNVVLANKAAGALTAVLPPELAGPPVNVYRACLHPDGLAGRTLNLDEWAQYLLGQLRRAVALTADPELDQLLAEVSRYPNIADLGTRSEPALDDPQLLIPFRVEIAGREVSMFTTLTSFGTPLDVTLDELAVELFFPADEPSEQFLRDAAAGAFNPA
jgi:transcriptional regulator with XRE-family HTH domain